MVLGMAVEGVELEVWELPPPETDRDLFRLARAFGCEPLDVTPPSEDGVEDGARTYVIDFSKADPRTIEELGWDGNWEPVEETPADRAKRLKDGMAAIAEYEAEYGAFTADEKAWARGVMASLGIGVDG